MTTCGFWLVAALSRYTRGFTCTCCFRMGKSSRIFATSNVVALGWTLLYGVLAVRQSDELAAWTTDVALIAIGAAAGLAAYRAAAKNYRA